MRLGRVYGGDGADHQAIMPDFTNSPVVETVLMDAASMHTWIRPMIAAFAEIQSLPENWDSYGARIVKEELIQRALHVLGLVMEHDSPVPSVVPRIDGGVQLEWHRRKQDLEIVFSADKQLQYFYRNLETAEASEGSAKDVNKLMLLMKNIA